MEPTNDTGPIKPYNDRRIHDVAPALDAWFDQQRARPEDDPPPLDEMDRLLGILGHAAGDLPLDAKMRLTTAWAAVYRLAIGWATQQAVRQRRERLVHLYGLWATLGEELEELANLETEPIAGATRAKVVELARELTAKASALRFEVLSLPADDEPPAVGKDGMGA